jgi:hypothetical protein
MANPNRVLLGERCGVFLFSIIFTFGLGEEWRYSDF